MTKLYIYSIIIILIIIILFIFGLNYKNGKYYNSKKTDKIYYIDYLLPTEQLINKTLNIVKKKGTILDPSKNLKNAKGKKINYTLIKDLIPELVEFYLCKKLQDIVSEKIGCKLYFAPKSEQYRIFVRLYDDKDDFLNWHYDNNFTEGKRYTIVIPILVDEDNTAEFQTKESIDKIKTYKVDLGKAIVYNGSNVYHRITPQKENNRRLVVIIPMYTNYKINIIGKMQQYFRKITYKTLSL